MAEPSAPSRSAHFPAPPLPIQPLPIARWLWVVAAVALIVAAGVAIWGIAAYHSQNREGHAMIDALHAQMRLGDDAGIFNTADPAYQKEVGRNRSDKLFDFLNERLGAPQSSTLIAWHVETNTHFGETETLAFMTKFAKGSGTETLTMHKVSGKFAMLGYNVKSPLLHESNVPADLKP